MTNVDQLTARVQKETTLSRREAEAVAYSVEGLSPPEIADEMGITRQAVHSHLHRAREKHDRAERTVDVLDEIAFGED